MTKYKSALYKNKYRTQSLRLPFYNYSAPGYYFIIICTKSKQCYFGQVDNGKILLNKYGKNAENYLLKIVKQCKNIALDEFVIMPNHVHVIIRIVEAIHDGCERMMPQPVEAIHELPLRKKMIKNRRRMVLPMLIGKYKMMTSKAIHKLSLRDFA